MPSKNAADLVYRGDAEIKGIADPSVTDPEFAAALQRQRDGELEEAQVLCSIENKEACLMCSRCIAVDSDFGFFFSLEFASSSSCVSLSFLCVSHYILDRRCPACHPCFSYHHALYEYLFYIYYIEKCILLPSETLCRFLS
jgi:hypothetical protein